MQQFDNCSKSVWLTASDNDNCSQWTHPISQSYDNLQFVESFRNFVRYFGAVFYSLLIIGGTIANILGIVVIRGSSEMHTSKGIFIALAVTDTIVLWINPLRYWMKFVFDQDLRITANIMCKLHTYSSYTSRDCATWILCLLTFERFVFACAPTKARHLYNKTRKLILWSLVLTFLCLKNTPLFWKLENMKQKNMTQCDTEDKSFRHIFFFLNMSIYSLIPTILLLICNVGLMRVLRRATKTHKSLSVGHAVADGKKLSGDFGTCGGFAHGNSTKRRRRTVTDRSLNQTNRLLIPVSMFYLLTSLPQCIFEILDSQFNWKLSNDLSRDKKHILEGVVYLLVMLASCNNGANCVIYFLSSQVFRKKVICLFRCEALDYGRSHAVISYSLKSNFEMSFCTTDTVQRANSSLPDANRRRAGISYTSLNNR